MKFLLLLFLYATASCQNILQRQDYKRLFADHLFCSGDYLRAVEEYESCLHFGYNDTIDFKIMLSLNAMNKYDLAEQKSVRLMSNSSFKDLVVAERLKILMTGGNFSGLRDLYSSSRSEYTAAKKLRNFSFFYSDKDSLPSPPYLLIPFNEAESSELQTLYDKKMNLPSKDPVLAGFLSVMFPGAGKIYTEEYGDAVFAALATGIFGYIAYSSFKADHTFRGYLFSGIAGWFYAGGIYGSAASAQIFNAKVSFSFTKLLDEYLRIKNYFLPDYGFCK